MKKQIVPIAYLREKMFKNFFLLIMTFQYNNIDGSVDSKGPCSN